MYILEVYDSYFNNKVRLYIFIIYCHVDEHYESKRLLFELYFCVWTDDYLIEQNIYII